MNPIAKRLLIAAVAGLVSATAIVASSEEKKRKERRQSRRTTQKAKKNNLVDDADADAELNKSNSSKSGYRTLTEDAAYMASKKIKDKIQNAVIDQAGLRDVVDAMAEGKERLSSVAEAVREEVRERAEMVTNKAKKVSAARDELIDTAKKVAEVPKEILAKEEVLEDVRAKAEVVAKKAFDKATNTIEEAKNYIPGDPDEVREWGSNMERAMDKLSRWASGPGTPKTSDNEEEDVVTENTSSTDVVDAKF